MPLSSMSVGSPFLYNMAVLTFIVDFFLVFPSLGLPKVRLSDMTVWRARNFDFGLAEDSGSESRSLKRVDVV